MKLTVTLIKKDSNPKNPENTIVMDIEAEDVKEAALEAERKNPGFEAVGIENRGRING